MQTVTRRPAAFRVELGARAIGLDDLFRKYAPMVATWATRLGGPGFDADDVVQELFLVAQRRLAESRFEGFEEAKLRTWLYRTTAHIVMNQRRRHRWRRWLGGSEGELDGVRDTVPTPIEDLESRRRATMVYRILDRLDDKYRTVLVLFEMEGLPGEEIAEIMNIKPDLVWVWLHRARKQFLRSMKAMGVSPQEVRP